MQQYLIEDAAQNVPVPLLTGGGLHRLGDGAAQRTGGAGELGQKLPSHVGRVGGRRGDLRPIGAHHLAAEGLLLIGALDHINLTVQPQIGARHGEGGAPLAGAGLGRHALQALLLGVVGLRNGRVQLVGAGGVVALKLIVNPGGCLQLLLQTVGPDQGRGTVHLIKIPNLLGNLHIGGVLVQLLTHQLPAEHALQLGGGHRFAGAGIEQRRGLDLHVGPDVVPGPRQLRFLEVNLIGNFLVHIVYLLLRLSFAGDNFTTSGAICKHLFQICREISRRSRRIIRFSSREMYDWEIPIISATSFWVFSARPPRPNRITTIRRSRSGSRSNA